MMSRNRVIVPLIATLALSVPLSRAQTSTPEEPTVEEATAGKASKQEAKDKRIEEYLRKREERRARKDLKREDRESQEIEAAAAKVESQQIAAEAAAAAAVPQPAAEMTAAPKKSNRRAKAGASSHLPKHLARAQHNVRISELANDPTVQEYLVMIDEQRASPHQLAAFGSFLAQNGMLKEALEYYQVALRIEPMDPLLWINDGTLRLKGSELSSAASSFSRALSLDPNNAVAHYSLGSTLHEMGKYDEALLEYKMALRIDPTLGDPARNPSAAHNSLLTAVKLLLYQEQAGSLSMPLLDVETGRLMTDTRGPESP